MIQASQNSCHSCQEQRRHRHRRRRHQFMSLRSPFQEEVEEDEDLSNRCKSCSRRKLRRNSSLSSIWSSWEDQKSTIDPSTSSTSVVCGVPGVGVSIRPRDSSRRPKSAVLNDAEDTGDIWKTNNKRRVVTFNLPRVASLHRHAPSPSPPSQHDNCCCCCCCCCCYFLSDDEDEFIQSHDHSWSRDAHSSPLPPPPKLPPKKNHDHYQTPHDRDGEYSYAYDSSVSPAFLIKWNDYDLDGNNARKENVYEEIVDVREKIKKFTTQENQPHEESNSDSGIGNIHSSSADSTKSHRSFSQGTLDISPSKKDVIPTRPSRIKLNRPDSFSSSDETFNSEEAKKTTKSRHQRVMNQLRLDGENFVTSPSPSPSPPLPLSSAPPTVEKPESTNTSEEMKPSRTKSQMLSSMFRKVTKKHFRNEKT